MAADSNAGIGERFWARVRRTEEGCWEWTGNRLSSGYGRTFVRTRRGEYAHRVAYELSHGPLLPGVLVCHRCDNRGCVRPDHVFAGTQQDNIEDCMSKGRKARGSRHGRAKLTGEGVDQLRTRYSTGGSSYRALAREYGVSSAQVARIVRGLHWCK